MRSAIIAVWIVAAATLAVPEAGAQVSAADSAAIRATALDYVESWYEGNVERMERCLHTELAKRIIVTDKESGRDRLEQMGALRLVQGVKRGGGTRTPAEKQIKKVEILDIYGDIASVKAEMSGWIDYMHIGKWNDRWVIVNVLWEMKPKEQS